MQLCGVVFLPPTKLEPDYNGSPVKWQNVNDLSGEIGSDNCNWVTGDSAAVELRQPRP